MAPGLLRFGVMPRTKQDEAIEAIGEHEIDALTEAQRQRVVGHPGKEHEDIEASRRPMRRDVSNDVDDETLSEEEMEMLSGEELLEEEIDLDRAAEQPGPDA